MFAGTESSLEGIYTRARPLRWRWPGTLQELHQLQVTMSAGRGHRPGHAVHSNLYTEVPTMRSSETDSAAELARQLAPVAVRALARLALHAKSESTRLAAAVALLDRGLGRPPQALAVAAALGTAEASMDAEAARAALGELVARMASAKAAGVTLESQPTVSPLTGMDAGATWGPR